MLKVLLGVSGGIAAYKTAALASGLKKRSFEVKTIMTPAAGEFIMPLTFKALTGNRVYTDLFSKEFTEDHTSLAGWGDIMVIAPATANTIAKIVCGVSDNLLAAVVLDFTGPVFLCPSMHENMWNNPATKNNIRIASERGYIMIGPENGDLAGGKKGMGRMTEPDTAIERIIESLNGNFPDLASLLD